MWTPARLLRAVMSLAVCGGGLPASAKDLGSPETFNPRDKYRYSFDYYREHGAFGPPSERLNPDQPLGHMSRGHGGGHR